MSVVSLTDLCHATNLRLLSSLLPVAANPYLQAHHQPPRKPISITPFHNPNLVHTTHQYSTSSNTLQNASSQSSVSPVETSHFSRLAATWWDPSGPSRLLHLMNPLRHTFITSCLASSTPPSSWPRNKNTPHLRYLDIGCGGGIFAESAARLPHTRTVTALDPTPSVITVAKSHQRTDPSIQPPKLIYLNCAIEDLPIPIPPSSSTTTEEDKRADILTLFEVIEHIDHPASFLRSCIPHLKPGGWIIGSTISRSVLSLLTTKVIAEAPVVGIVPRGTHDWNKYINPEELGGWFEKRNRDGKAKEEGERWGPLKTQGVIYVPGFGWRMMEGVEGLGNYFFGVQRLEERR